VQAGMGACLMYQIIIKKKAKKFIDSLPVNERRRVVAAIELLPNGEDIKKLKGHDKLLRLRVGEYRIIYTVDNGELIVYVIDAGSRGQIYNRY
jgi:mRNA interferase RelE/StbE